VTAPFPIRVVEGVYDDVWVRDTGPTFVTHARAGLRGVDWDFNGWGEFRATGFAADYGVARQILSLAEATRYKCSIVLEGGSIHVDGNGTLLTTAECLLNKNRNPQCSKEDIEKQLQWFLGVKKIVWLPFGIDGDTDTDGHVDNLAAFCRPGEVVLSWPDDEADPQFLRSSAALQLLESTEDSSGRRITIHKLVHPPFMKYEEEDVPSDVRTAGVRIAASYANFYCCNGGIVMPGFLNGEGTDAVALQQMQAIFPGRRIIQVQTREIALGGGNIHCVTQQEPFIRTDL